jgi:FkbM family methyltransferase
MTTPGSDIAPFHLAHRFRLLIVRGLFLLIAQRRRSKLPMIRLGSDYGGWWTPTTGLGRDSICYCAGVGEDATFDLALVERFRCQVISLDPTPKAGTYITGLKTPQELRFVAVGVAGSNREARFYLPRCFEHTSLSITNLQQTDNFIVATVRTISSLMEELGHDVVDLIKLDIEGAEYEVLSSLHRDNIYPTTLCVEFDQPHSVIDTWRAIRRLHSVGYSTAIVDRFNFTFVRDRTHKVLGDTPKPR